MSTTELAGMPAHESVLAATSQPADAAGEAGEYLTFRLGAEEYGIDILCVQEIRSYEAPTRIANAPSLIKGVIDLRGTIVPIVDLRLKFGFEDARYDSFTVVIILNIGQRVLGVVVDSVSDVVQLALEHVRPVPEFSQMVDASFLRGIGSITGRQGLPDRMLVLIEIERLISGRDIGLFNEFSLAT